MTKCKQSEVREMKSVNKKIMDSRILLATQVTMLLHMYLNVNMKTIYNYKMPHSTNIHVYWLLLSTL